MRLSKSALMILSITGLLMVPNYASLGQSYQTQASIDLDPLVDLTVTFEVLKIRSFEKVDNHLNMREYIDRYSDPDFYLNVWIDNELFESPIWRNTRYVYEPDWAVTVNVPDDEEWVNVTIQLWDWNLGRDQKCDISGSQVDGKDNYEVTLQVQSKIWVLDR